MENDYDNGDEDDYGNEILLGTKSLSQTQLRAEIKEEALVRMGRIRREIFSTRKTEGNT